MHYPGIFPAQTYELGIAVSPHVTDEATRAAVAVTDGLTHMAEAKCVAQEPRLSPDFLRDPKLDPLTDLGASAGLTTTSQLDSMLPLSAHTSPI